MADRRRSALEPNDPAPGVAGLERDEENCGLSSNSYIGVVGKSPHADIQRDVGLGGLDGLGGLVDGVGDVGDVGNASELICERGRGEC